MLRRELTKKGLARALSLVLAVSLAMPGTALAAATQPSPNEAAVESVYEEEAAEEEAAAGETAGETADETAEEGAPSMNGEGAETADPAEEAPAEPEEEDAVEEAGEDEDPAAAGDEDKPADPEDEGIPADPEGETGPEDEETDDAAAQEDTSVPAAAAENEDQYFVKFDLNGGMLAEELETADISTYQMYKDGAAVYREYDYLYLEKTFYFNNESFPVAIRDHYVFDGWTETKDGEETVDEYYSPSKDITLYAKWKEAFVVKFDLNGGTLADELETADFGIYKMLTDGATVAKGDLIYLKEEFWHDYDPASVPVAKRNGYVLSGWTETKDGKEKADFSYYPSKDITLYARWKKLHTVKFDLNGGTITEELKIDNADAYEMFTDGVSVVEGDDVHIRTEYWYDSKYIPAAKRDGYYLDGWTETKDGEETIDDYYYPSKDITLYAKWIKTHTVTFDLNGGTLADDLETEDEELYKMYKDGTAVVVGDSVYLDIDYWDGYQLKTPIIRDGYRLTGWTETKDGPTPVDILYKPTKDIKLYAKWVKVYTITFVVNGGTWAGDYYQREYGNGYVAEKDEHFYLPDSNKLKRSGYGLSGWTTTKDGTAVLDREYIVTKDITLYAKWVKTCKVTFDAGEGYFGSNTSTKTKVLEIGTGRDIGYYLDHDSYIPHNGSKVFLGWYKDSELNTPVKKSDTITEDITYYAKYETKVYKITVTNLKGAEYTNRATGKYISESESTAESYSFYIYQGDGIGSLRAYKNDENALFFFDQECKTRPFYRTYVPTWNMTVYAKWNTEVTITWDAAGGQNSRGESTGTVTSKKNLMCENLPTRLTKAGYYFVGWYDEADASKKTLPASHVFKRDTKIKAKWAAGIKITFKSGGGTFTPEGDPVIYIKAKTSVGEGMNFSIKRTGYTLTGWKSSATGKVVTSIYDEKPASATTYTAVWIADSDAVNVTLMAGDGSLYDGDNDRYVTKLVVKVLKNSTFSGTYFLRYLEHDEPYKDLIVSGWSLSMNGSKLPGSYTFTKDVTLYPLWRKDGYINIALVTNGGVIDNDPDNDPKVYRSAKNRAFKLPGASNMEREGYTFLGWYTDPAFKTKVSDPDSFKTKTSCYLYAKWKEGTSGTSLLGKPARGDMFNLANNVKVTWKEVPGAKYYKVYREGVTNKSETRKDPVIVTTGLVGWDSAPGLTNGHAYRYKIVASTTGKGDSSGDSSQSYTKVMYRLKTVAIRSAKNTAPGVVTVTYDKTASGDSYVLQYSENQDMTGAKTKVVLGANNTSYTIGGLKKGKTYYISIRVRKKVDGIDYYTTFGVPKKVTITK